MMTPERLQNIRLDVSELCKTHQGSIELLITLEQITIGGIPADPDKQAARLCMLRSLPLRHAGFLDAVENQRDVVKAAAMACILLRPRVYKKGGTFADQIPGTNLH